MASDEAGKKMLETGQQLLPDYMPLIMKKLEASRAHDVGAATGIMFGKLRPISQKFKAAMF